MAVVLNFAGEFTPKERLDFIKPWDVFKDKLEAIDLWDQGNHETLNSYDDVGFEIKEEALEDGLIYFASHGNREDNTNIKCHLQDGTYTTVGTYIDLAEFLQQFIEEHYEGRDVTVVLIVCWAGRSVFWKAKHDDKLDDGTLAVFARNSFAGYTYGNLLQNLVDSHDLNKICLNAYVGAVQTGNLAPSTSESSPLSKIATSELGVCYYIVKDYLEPQYGARTAVKEVPDEAFYSSTIRHDATKAAEEMTKQVYDHGFSSNVCDEQLGTYLTKVVRDYDYQGDREKPDTHDEGVEDFFLRLLFGKLGAPQLREKSKEIQTAEDFRFCDDGSVRFMSFRYDEDTETVLGTACLGEEERDFSYKLITRFDR